MLVCMTHETEATKIVRDIPSDSMTKSAFSRIIGISPARSERLRRSGVISGYTMEEAWRFRNSPAASRIVSTPFELVVIRLGIPNGDTKGYLDTMTTSEITFVAQGPWTRSPDTLPDTDVVHVTYAGIVVGVFALTGFEAAWFDSTGAERWNYKLRPLSVVKGSLLSPNRDTSRNKGTLSQTQLSSLHHVGHQLLTSGGAPVIAAHPSQIKE